MLTNNSVVSLSSGYVSWSETDYDLNQGDTPGLTLGWISVLDVGDSPGSFRLTDSASFSTGTPTSAGGLTLDAYPDLWLSTESAEAGGWATAKDINDIDATIGISDWPNGAAILVKYRPSTSVWDREGFLSLEENAGTTIDDDSAELGWKTFEGAQIVGGGGSYMVYQNKTLDIGEAAGLLRGIGSGTNWWSGWSPSPAVDQNKYEDALYLHVKELDSQPQYGTISGLSDKGAFKYTPDDPTATGFGSKFEQLHVVLDDGRWKVNRNFNIEVREDLPPDANDDGYSASQPWSSMYQVVQGGKLSIDKTFGVLYNDFEPDGNWETMNASVAVDAQHGHVVMGSDGSFTYTSDGKYFQGIDYFTYKVADQYNYRSDSAKVSILVHGITVGLGRGTPSIGQLNSGDYSPQVINEDGSSGNAEIPVYVNVDGLYPLPSDLVIPFNVSGSATWGSIGSGDYDLVFRPTTGFDQLISPSSGIITVSKMSNSGLVGRLILTPHKDDEMDTEDALFTLPTSQNYQRDSLNYFDWVTIKDRNSVNSSGAVDASCGCVAKTDVSTNQATGALNLNYATTGDAAVRWDSSENPHPIITVNTVFPRFTENLGVIGGVKATLTIGNPGGPSASTTVYYKTDGVQSGDILTYAIQVDATALPAGHYNWSIVFTYLDADGHTYSPVVPVEIADGTTEINNLKNSAFGNRWAAQGADQLIPSTSGDGVTLMTAGGQSYFFTRDPSNWNRYLHTEGEAGFSQIVFDGVNYTLTDKNGNTAVFGAVSASGVPVVLERTEHDGSKTTYGYTFGDDRLTSITNPFGQVTSYHFDPVTEQLEWSKDQFGRRTDFTYEPDADGRVLLKKIEAPALDDGSRVVTEYGYDEFGLMNWIGTSQYTPGQGTVLQDEQYVVYDKFHEVKELQHKDPATHGVISTEDLTSQQSLGLAYVPGTTGVDWATAVPLKKWSLPTGDKTDNLGQHSTFILDQFGHTYSETNSDGATTVYQRDSEGQVLTKFEPDKVTGQPGAPGTGPITQYKYDSNGNMTQMILPGSLGTRTWEYDSSPITNPFHLVTKYTDENGRVTKYHYDASGNKDTITQIVGLDDTTSSEHDDVITRFEYTQPGNASGLPPGLMTKMYDGNNNLTQYDYWTKADNTPDHFRYGQLEQVTLPPVTTISSIPGDIGDPGPVVRLYDYDKYGNLSKYTDELNRVTEYQYDALGRLSKVTEPDADKTDNTLPAPVTEYKYDALGRTVKITKPDPDGNGTVYQAGVTTFDYTFEPDTHNRVVTTKEYSTLFGGLFFRTSTSVYDAEGELLESTDALGRTTINAYSHYHLKTVTLPDPDGDGPLGQILSSRQTTYDYDKLGRLTSTTGPDPLADNTAPVAVGTAITVGLNTAIPTAQVNLSDLFNDTEDADSALRYEFVSGLNGTDNANLIDHVSIITAADNSRQLVVTFSGLESGTAHLHIRALDTQGEPSPDVTIQVTRDSAPSIDIYQDTTHSPSYRSVGLQLAPLADGGVIALWADTADGATGTLLAQRLNAHGDKVGSVITVTTSWQIPDGPGNNVIPLSTSLGIAATSDGHFMAVWTQTDSSNNVRYYGRIYNLNGASPGWVGAAFLISGPHSFYLIEEAKISVLALANQNFAVVFKQPDQPGSVVTVSALRLYDSYHGWGLSIPSSTAVTFGMTAATPDGGFLTYRNNAIFHYSATGTVIDSHSVSTTSPPLAIGGDGTMIAPTAYTFEDRPSGFWIRKLGADGSPVTADIMVYGTPWGTNEYSATVKILDDGSFAVVWLHSDASDSTTADIKYRRYDALGNPLDAAPVVLQTGIPNTAPTMVGTAAASLVFGWGDVQNSTSSGAGVHGRVVPGQLGTVTPDFRVSSISPDGNVHHELGPIVLTFSRPPKTADLIPSNFSLTLRAVGAASDSSIAFTIERVSSRQYLIKPSTVNATAIAGDYTLEILPTATIHAALPDTVTLGGTKSWVFHVTPDTNAVAAVSTTPIYDDLGRVKKTVDAEGNVVEYQYSVGLPHRTVTTTTTVTTAAGVQQYTRIDEYDELDRLVKVTLPTVKDETGAVATPTLQYFYDKNGNLTSKKNEFGYTTIYTYDKRNRLRKQTEPLTTLTVTDPAKYSYYDLAGRKTSETDFNGDTTTYKYDDLDRLIKVTQPDPDGPSTGLPSPVTDYQYDNLGRLVEQKDADPDGDSNPSLERPVTDYEYDAFGNLNKVTLPDPDPTPANGTRAYIRYFYDLAGQLFAKVDELNRQTGYLYDQQGRLTDLVGANPGTGIALHPPTPFFLHYFPTFGSLVTHYDYDGAGNKIKETDPLGHITQYAYDKLGRLISTTDAMGGVTSTQYDAVSRATATTDALGRTTTYDFDAGDHVVQVTQPDPDAKGPLLAPVTTYGYDRAGNLRWTKDPRGAQTDYTYDRLDRLTQVKQPHPDVGGTDSNRPTTDYTYDKGGRLTDITLPDPDGPPNSPPQSRQHIKNVYDHLGNLTSTDNNFDTTSDTTHQVTAKSYDNLGRLIQVVEPDPTTGQALSGATPIGAITTYSYDGLGNLTKMVEPNAASGIANGPTAQYFYDAASQKIQMIAPDPDAPSSGNPSIVTDYQYDKLGRLTSQNVHSATATWPGAPHETTSYVYDAANNLIMQLDPEPVYGDSGLLTAYAFDALNRPIAEIDSRGGVTRKAYDAAGNLIGLVDPDGNRTEYEYDRLDRAIRETNALELSRTYAYDENGNLTQKIDREGQKTGYEYDRLNQQVKEQWFNSAGVVTHQFDYGYDLAGRMKSASDKLSPTAPTPLTSYSYTNDVLGRATKIDGTYSLLTAAFTLSQTFDALSQRKQLKATIGGTVDFVNDYDYDKLGQEVLIKQSGLAGGHSVPNKRVDLAYTNVGQLKSIQRSTNLSVAGGQAATTAYTRDDFGRVTNISHDLLSGSPDPSHNYWYDYANHVTLYDGSSGIEQYSYDSTGQLVWNRTQLPTTTGYHEGDPDNPDGDPSFSYDIGNYLTNLYVNDANGNRVQRQVQFQAYAPDDLPTPDAWTNTGATSITTNNRLSVDKDFTYTYDKEGNLSTKIRNSGDPASDFKSVYTFDYRNRLTAVTLRDNSDNITQKVVYSYDAFDRMVGRAVYSGNILTLTDTQVFVFDPTAKSEAVLRLNSTGAVQNRYLWADAVDQILADESAADGTRWALNDRQGTPLDWVNSSGDVVAHRRYDAFGNLEPDQSSSSTGELVFGYTGRYHDPLTGLQYNWRRWYDPATGRWLSEDPIGFDAGDTNLGRYVGNSPTNATDPTGLAPGYYDAKGHPISADSAANSYAAAARKNYLEIEQRLQALGQKLDMADPCKDPVVVEDDAIAIESLMARYQSNIDAAQQAWLASSHSWSTLDRVSQFTPLTALSLPMAEESARRQILFNREAGKILNRQISILDFAAGSLTAVDTANTAASLAIGGGYLIQSAKTGGKWAFAKAVGIGAAAYLGEQAVESTARRLGASEDTIKGARLAAAVVAFILVRRAGGACFVAGTQVVTEEESSRALSVAASVAAIVAGGAGESLIKRSRRRKRTSLDEVPTGDQTAANQDNEDDRHVPTSVSCTPEKTTVVRVGKAGVRPTCKAELDNRSQRGSRMMAPVSVKVPQGVAQPISVPTDVKKLKQLRHSPSMRSRLATTWLVVCVAIAGYLGWSLFLTSKKDVFHTQNIESLRPGDLVLAQNADTGEVGPHRVLEAFQRTTDHLRIVRSRSTDGEEQEFKTTNEHPFWVPQKGWVEAGKLSLGDQLLQADGKPAVVVATTYEAHPEGVSVFNIKVEGVHTYYVAANGAGAAPIFVHNANCPGPSERGASNPARGRFDNENVGARGYDNALEGARGNAGNLGPSTQKMYDPNTGTLIGERSADGTRGWRIDQDHVNWWDWSGGKKGAGGRYGHEFFPPTQSGPHSPYKGFAPWTSEE